MKNKKLKPVTPDQIIKWIDDKFEETRAEIIIRGQLRDYIIVPYKIKNYEN